MHSFIQRTKGLAFSGGMLEIGVEGFERTTPAMRR
jgi:hypothetical protein